MNLKEARTCAGLTQAEMSERFEIPKRTIENWEAGKRKCPVYVEKLIVEKLEEIIMMKSEDVAKKANEINELQDSLPEVSVGDIVKLTEIWDGNGDVPEDSYSYILTDNGMDLQSNYPVHINYVFDIVEENEDPLQTVIKVTNIEML
ncbi:MAG: helix-turn-helix transcriptional regulator [Clostridium sp.]|nr:helix-turn-helix transcriptional regulator [Clostridiales bacterium]MDU3109539.1 helix-turn-helix transcriptional regulator [Clostridium sp.]